LSPGVLDGLPPSISGLINRLDKVSENVEKINNKADEIVENRKASVER